MLGEDHYDAITEWIMISCRRAMFLMISQFWNYCTSNTATSAIYLNNYKNIRGMSTNTRAELL